MGSPRCSNKWPSTLEKTPEFESAGHFAGMMLDANKLEPSRWKYVRVALLRQRAGHGTLVGLGIPTRAREPVPGAIVDRGEMGAVTGLGAQGQSRAGYETSWL